MIDRRLFIKSSVGLSAISVITNFSDLLIPRAQAHPKSLAKNKDKHGHPTFEPLSVLIVLYPGCTHLDWVGPHMWISTMMNTEINIVAKKRGILTGSPSIGVSVEKTFNDVKGKSFDILLVPGAFEATADCILDTETIEFVKDVGSRCKYITSVCTGSLILGAAGLLKGYKATSYWPVTHLLKNYECEFVNHRVVFDRNRITGGGVTAGIDFGLELVKHIRGEDFAKVSQLAIEYDPSPTLNSGSLADADPKIISMTKSILGPGIKKIEDAVAKSGKRL